jgi:hypothetical protein
MQGRESNPAQTNKQTKKQKQLLKEVSSAIRALLKQPIA